MYIPSSFNVTDQQEIISFMRTYSFATIVTSNNRVPTATHLPFAVIEKEGAIYLYSHFAKANEQSKEIGNHEVLVIFAEPHAYISTRHYDSSQNVPTWNYMAVHAYGKGEILSDREGALLVLNHMIAAFEKEYQTQWESLPEAYKEGLLKGIVPFRIKVTAVQAKKKISQNRSASEKERIIQALEKSQDTPAKTIAELMKKESH